MVIVLQELQWSFAQDDKDSIQEFRNLAQAKVHGPRVGNLNVGVAQLPGETTTKEPLVHEDGKGHDKAIDAENYRVSATTKLTKPYLPKGRSR